MKNRMFLLLAGIVSASACNERAEEFTQPIKSGLNNEINTTPPPGWGLNRTYDLTDNECYAPAGDCFDEVIITPPKENVAQEFDDAVTDGSTGVSTFFNGADWSQLFPDLGNHTAQLSSLQSGNVRLVRSPSLVTGSSNVAYCAGLASNSDAQIRNNPDFVLTLTW